MATVPRIALSVTITRYDPLEAPDPKAWLEMDESERIELVRDYHREAGIRQPNDKVHAVFHATIENQIALGEELPIKRALERLMAEGLDRHEAVHAICLALSNYLYDLANKDRADADPNPDYFAAVARLTADDWRRSGDDEDEEASGPERILDRLGARGALPVEAINDARADRATMVPLFIAAIERYVAGESDPAVEDALLLVFHLLGEWRETSAYRPLAKLLRLPSDEVDAVLGNAMTETSHRVMAAVFDGDPKPLYDLILDRSADEFVRARMCEALAMLARRDQLPRSEVARFLHACHADLEQSTCFVWDGWQSAIALLGLVELKPLVERAFRRGYLSPEYSSFEDFQDDLRQVIEHRAPPEWQSKNEFELFGDTIEELSHWSWSSRDEDEDDAEDDADDWEPKPPQGPIVNPFKGVGRNDPCPCGSGKKFKKCCLA